MPKVLQVCQLNSFIILSPKKTRLCGNLRQQIEAQSRKVFLAKRKKIYISLQNAKATFEKENYSKKCQQKLFSQSS